MRHDVDNQRKLATQQRAAAETVAFMLWTVLVDRRPADRVLNAHFRQHPEWGSRDRRFIMESVFHILRWWGWLRPLAPGAFLAAVAGARVPGAAAPLSDTAGGDRAATSVPGARWPELPPHAWAPLMLAANLLGEAVFAYDAAGELAAALPSAERNESDGEARMLEFLTAQCGWASAAVAAVRRCEGAAERANQCLAAAGCPGAAPPAWEELLPGWCREEFGEAQRLARLLPWLQRRPPLWLRVQRGQVTEVMHALAELAFPARLSPRLPFAVATVNARVNLFTFKPYVAGAVEVQDLASQAVGLVCDPQPGQRWWDCCAGAGGKSLLLAQLMRGKGTIVASDVRDYKLDDLRKRARRAGFSNIQAKSWDGKPSDPRKAGFDGVLVDAPCSCSGTWRRNPAARWSENPDEARDLPKLQLEILGNAAGAVKPGGTLVYATCSLFRRENEGVVESFLLQRPEFVLEPFANPLTGGPTPGMTLFWPWDGDCDGMFAARLRRAKAPGASSKAG